MKFAFTFPGQGSQAVGMLSELAEACPEVKHTFGEASQALGRDLWRLVQAGPATCLNATEHTQPAMLCAGVAVWRAWQARGGPEPCIAAGHSLGEFSALVCAGSLAFDAAVLAVAARARLMQSAVPAGRGAIVALLGLADDDVRRICNEVNAERTGELVAAVNFNAPGQVVIAGHAGAVDAAVDAAKEAGARRALPLPMSVPVHCPLMQPACEPFERVLAELDFVPPRIPVVHTADLEVHADAEDIRRALVQQLVTPVRWPQIIRVMKSHGVDSVLEPGPGRVLTGLHRRIDPSLEVRGISDCESLETALEHVEAHA